MSISVYKGAKYRLLAGKKIYNDGSWVTLPDNAKMYLNGVWHTIGYATVNPSDMATYMVHDNGAEPSTGTKWHITPNGNGTMDGSSWSNAASGSDVHAVLLSCTSGDSVYFSEGNYTTTRRIDIPTGVTLYGGFIAGNEQWETRDGFKHPTVFTGDGKIVFSLGGAVDGFVIKNYSSTGTTVKNSVITGGDVVVHKTAYNCLCYDTSSITIDTADSIYIVGTGTTTLAIVKSYGSVISNCVAKNITYSPLLTSEATDTIFISCHVKNQEMLCTGTLNGCMFIGCSLRCTVNRNSQTEATVHRCGIINGIAHSCTLLNCAVAVSEVEGSGSYKSNRYIGVIVGRADTSENMGAVNCVVANCDVSYATLYTREGEFGVIVTDYTAHNTCVHNSLTSDHDYPYIIRSDHTYSCVSWYNNSSQPHTEFYRYSQYTCAGSFMGSVVLGRDNSITKFTNTGYTESSGTQDVGECPNPLTHRNDFEAYVAAFGDWHPTSKSLLVGRGTYLSEAPTDADGVTRPDPPTIGAYEPKPEEE